MAGALALQKSGVDPVGAPDFTLPVSIIAQVIPQLDVNIAAQSISALNINIASISQGISISTNVSNMPSTFPLPDSQVSSLQQITIQNVATGLYIPINIAQVSAALNINNFPSSYPLPDSQVSTLQQITIQNVAAGLYIPINIAQATATVNSNATINGIAAGVYIPITIHSVEGGVVFNINISSISSGVTFNVTISGTPTINIQTSSGANIIIDKLTQASHGARQEIYIQNQGATASMTSTGAWRGKLFPRGMRGHPMAIYFYCDNTDTVAHTITVKVSPFIGLGPIWTGSISVAASSAADWRLVEFRKPWVYDSMFIWFKPDSLSLHIGMNCAAPEVSDSFASTDEISWAEEEYQWWVRIYQAGESIGDLPVSGTVNNVAIPNNTSGSYSGAVSVPAYSNADVIDIKGSGTVERLSLYCEHSTMEFVILIDGVQIDRYSIIAGYQLMPANLYSTGFTATTPQVQLIKYNASGECQMALEIPFQFRRSFHITAYNSISGPIYVKAGVIINKLQ